MNELIITGNLGTEPKLRTTSTGKQVCDFNVATTNRKDEDPVWVRCTAWEKTAELCNTYLSQGKKVLVKGPAKATSFTTEDGKTLTNLECTVRTIEFLSPKTGNGAGTQPVVNTGTGTDTGDTPSLSEIPF